MVLLAKPKSNTIEVLISKALINANISHDEFVLINDMLKAYDEIKEEIKNSTINMHDAIRKIYLLYRHNKITKKLYNNLIKTL